MPSALVAAGLFLSTDEGLLLAFRLLGLPRCTVGVASTGELRKAVGEGMVMVSMGAPPALGCQRSRAVDGPDEYS